MEVQFQRFYVDGGVGFLPQRPIRIFIGDFLGGSLGHARVGQGFVGDFQLVVGDRNVARIIGEEETRVGNQLVTMKKYEGALCGFHRHGIVVRRVLLHALEGHPAEVGAGVKVVVLYREIKLVAAALDGDFLSGCPQSEGGFGQVELGVAFGVRHLCAGQPGAGAAAETRHAGR